MFGEYFRVKASSHQRAGKVTNSLGFVLMKKNQSLI